MVVVAACISILTTNIWSGCLRRAFNTALGLSAGNVCTELGVVRGGMYIVATKPRMLARNISSILA